MHFVILFALQHFALSCWKILRSLNQVWVIERSCQTVAQNWDQTPSTKKERGFIRPFFCCPVLVLAAELNFVPVYFPTFVVLLVTRLLWESVRLTQLQKLSHPPAATVELCSGGTRLCSSLLRRKSNHDTC